MGHEPLRCLAVRVLKDSDGQIDSIEFESFLNDVAGRHRWLSTTEWLFVDPPVEADGLETQPVLMPELIAVKAIVADLANPEPRILMDHKLSHREERKWRWAASHIVGQKHFPWEDAYA